MVRGLDVTFVLLPMASLVSITGRLAMISTIASALTSSVSKDFVVLSATSWPSPLHRDVNVLTC